MYPPRIQGVSNKLLTCNAMAETIASGIGASNAERGITMKAGKKTRVVLDVALSLMIVFEMLIQFTGEFLHEVMGFAFFVCVLAHILLSAKWMKATARSAKTGKLTARRKALAAIGALLAVTTLVLAVSSIAISGILASTGFVWPFGAYAFWSSLHTVSAYGLCALVVVHLAMHWAFLASAFKVPYDPSRRHAIGLGVNAVAALGVIALGVTAAGKSLPQAVGIASAEVTDELEGEQVNDIAATSANAEAETQPAYSGKHGRRHDRGASKTGDPSQPSSSNGNGATSQGASDTATDSAAEPSDSSSAPSISGICTLCRKQCSLSAPKCDKPYNAGLI